MATLANARDEFEPDFGPYVTDTSEGSSGVPTPTDTSEGSDYAVTGSAPATATDTSEGSGAATGEIPAVIDPIVPGDGGGGTDTGSTDTGGTATGVDMPDRSIDATTVQELYPETPESGTLEVPTVATPGGADVQELSPEGIVETPVTEAETDTGGIIEGAVGEVTDLAGEAQQSELTAEQQVDAELARILGQDSPLLQQARAEAARMANARGLMNSSMAAGMTYAELVKQALPMAQQNADQAFQRELENARLRQEAGQFTAEEISRLRSLEAELGQELSIFNAEQLNEAERLATEMRVAIEQGNQQAYNEAALQLAELNRDAEAQQAELEYAAEERKFLERQAYNEKVIDAITTLNEQYMIGEQQIDIANIEGTYRQIISTNETAATLFDSYLNSIGQIFDNPDMSTAQTAEAVRTMVDMLEASLAMISGINGMDLETNLPGNTTTGGRRPGGGGGGGGEVPLEPRYQAYNPADPYADMMGD